MAVHGESMAGEAGNRWRRARRWTSVAIFLVFGVGSVLGYVALAMTINGQPPYNPFPGWIVLLQPTGAKDEVMLQVQSVVFTGPILPGPPGVPQNSTSYPLITYTWAVCGPQPSYKGKVVIGRRAKLTDITPIPDGSVLPPIGLISLPVNWTYGPTPVVDHISDPFIAPYTEEGTVQLIHINLSGIKPCQVTPGGLSASTFTGSMVQGVQGYLHAPIQRTWTAPFGWWSGPHSAQTWPAMGTVPDAMEVEVSGWTPPQVQYLQLIDDTPATWTVDSTNQPTSADASGLTWSSQTPIDPMARLTDSGSLTALQQWLVVAGVGLGIGGSMLASLVFQWLRPTTRNSTTSDEATPPRQPPAQRDTAPP